MKEVKIEFIEASQEVKYKEQYLKHMSNLKNVAFADDDTLSSVLVRLREGCDDKEIIAIDEWELDQNDGVPEMMASDIAGIVSGYYIFNFFER